MCFGAAYVIGLDEDPRQQEDVERDQEAVEVEVASAVLDAVGHDVRALAALDGMFGGQEVLIVVDRVAHG